MRNERDPRVRRSENQSPLETREVSRFSPEARELLERVDYEIYTLTGRSISDFTEEGRRFDYNLRSWFEKSPDFKKVYNLASMRSEVGVQLIKRGWVQPDWEISRYLNANPDHGLLPLIPSLRPGEDMQLPEELVVTVKGKLAHLSRTLSDKIPGVRAIIGEAPDYIELMHKHFDATGDALFTGDKRFDGYIAGVGYHDYIQHEYPHGILTNTKMLVDVKTFGKRFKMRMWIDLQNRLKIDVLHKSIGISFFDLPNGLGLDPSLGHAWRPDVWLFPLVVPTKN